MILAVCDPSESSYVSNDSYIPVEPSPPAADANRNPLVEIVVVPPDVPVDRYFTVVSSPLGDPEEPPSSVVYIGNVELPPPDPPAPNVNVNLVVSEITYALPPVFV